MPYKSIEDRRAYSNKWQKLNRDKLRPGRKRRKVNEYAKNQDRLHTPRGRYWRLKVTAKRREIDLSITFEEFLEEIKLPCVYCNAPVVVKQGSGIDRKNNLLGYVSGNIVSCCTLCNRIKGAALNYEEMKIAMSAVLKYRKNLVKKSSIKRSKGSVHIANSPLGALPMAGMNAPQGMPSPGQAQGGPNAPQTQPQMPPAMGPGQPY